MIGNSSFSHLEEAIKKSFLRLAKRCCIYCARSLSSAVTSKQSIVDRLDNTNIIKNTILLINDGEIIALYLY